MLQEDFSVVFFFPCDFFFLAFFFPFSCYCNIDSGSQTACYSPTHNQFFPASYPNPVPQVLLSVLSNTLSTKYKLYRLLPVVDNSGIFLFGFNQILYHHMQIPSFIPFPLFHLSYLKELTFCFVNKKIKRIFNSSGRLYLGRLTFFSCFFPISTFL